MSPLLLPSGELLAGNPPPPPNVKTVSTSEWTPRGQKAAIDSSRAAPTPPPTTHTCTLPQTHLHKAESLALNPQTSSTFMATARSCPAAAVATQQDLLTSHKSNQRPEHTHSEQLDRHFGGWHKTGLHAPLLPWPGRTPAASDSSSPTHRKARVFCDPPPHLLQCQAAQGGEETGPGFQCSSTRFGPATAPAPLSSKQPSSALLQPPSSPPPPPQTTTATTKRHATPLRSGRSSVLAASSTPTWPVAPLGPAVACLDASWSPDASKAPGAAGAPRPNCGGAGGGASPGPQQGTHRGLALPGGG